MQHKTIGLYLCLDWFVSRRFFVRKTHQKNMHSPVFSCLLLFLPEEFLPDKEVTAWKLEDPTQNCINPCHRYTNDGSYFTLLRPVLC